MKISLLNKRKYKVNEKITIIIPTIEEIKGSDLIDGSTTNEDLYYEAMSLFFTVPSSCIAQLDNMGIDFTKISDFELFILLYSSMNKDNLRKASKYIFDEFNFADFEIGYNQNKTLVLYNEKADVEINEYIYHLLSTLFCTMHFYSKARKINCAGETTRKWIIERAKVKLERAKKKKKSNGSELDDLILAMVNNQNFKYDFESVNKLTIYNFQASARYIIQKYQADNLYRGIYTGTIDLSKLSMSEKNKLNWLTLDFNTIKGRESIGKLS